MLCVVAAPAAPVALWDSWPPCAMRAGVAGTRFCVAPPALAAPKLGLGAAAAAAAAVFLPRAHLCWDGKALTMAMMMRWVCACLARMAFDTDARSAAVAGVRVLLFTAAALLLAAAV